MNRDVKPPDGYEDDGLFQTVMFGYDRAQVDEYIDTICDELHVLSSAVKRMTPIEHDLYAANAEVQRLREIIASNTSNAVASVRIQQMLHLAEEEAAALRQGGQQVLDQAHREAAEIRRAAEEDCQRVAADRRREYERLREDVLAGAQAEAARIVAEANGRSGGLALASHVKNGPAKGAAGGAKNAGKKHAAKPEES